MFVVSLREHFSDSHHLAHDLDIRHAVVSSNELGEPISLAAWLEHIAHKKITLLIHGYNNNQQDAFDAYLYLKENLKRYAPSQTEQVVGLLWPGGDKRLEYFLAKKRADAVGKRLAKLLSCIHQHTKALDISAHSMGNRVLFQALKHCPEKTVRYAYAVAPAVSARSFEPGEEFHLIPKRCQKLVVFFSRNDKILKVFFEVAEHCQALGFSGPYQCEQRLKKSPQCYVVDCSAVIDDHSAYRKRQEFFQVIATLNHLPQTKIITLTPQNTPVFN